MPTGNTDNTISRSSGNAIGTRVFTDGVTCTVYLDPAGKQDVLDDDRQRVYGVWIPPALNDPNAQDSSTHA